MDWMGRRDGRVGFEVIHAELAYQYTSLHKFTS